MSRIPKEQLEKWTKLKHEMLPFIDKLKGPTVDDDYKKELKKKVTALYDQFDSGLSKTLKAANDAKSDKDAVKALSVAIKTSNDYISKTKAAGKDWGTSGRSIAESIEGALKKINASCESALVALAK